MNPATRARASPMIIGHKFYLSGRLRAGSNSALPAVFVFIPPRTLSRPSLRLREGRVGLIKLLYESGDKVNNPEG